MGLSATISWCNYHNFKLFLTDNWIGVGVGHMVLIAILIYVLYRRNKKSQHPFRRLQNETATGVSIR